MEKKESSREEKFEKAKQHLEGCTPDQLQEVKRDIMFGGLDDDDIPLYLKEKKKKLDILNSIPASEIDEIMKNLKV